MRGELTEAELLLGVSRAPSKNSEHYALKIRASIIARCATDETLLSITRLKPPALAGQL